MNNHDISWSQAAEIDRMAEYKKAQEAAGESTAISKVILSMMLIAALAMPWAVIYLMAILGGVK